MRGHERRRASMDIDRLPEPPIEAEVSIKTFDMIDMPIDWLGEEWALSLTDDQMGQMFRLIMASLRQVPAGSLPGDHDQLQRLTGLVPDPVVLGIWQECSDGRRYWERLVPVVESAWSRKRGKQTKDAERQRRRRLMLHLVRAGLTETGARNHEVQDAVFIELGAQKLTEQNVFNAAQAAGLIGPVTPLRDSQRDRNELSQARPKPSRVTESGQLRDRNGQLRDSPRDSAVTVSDSPHVSEPGKKTTYGGG